MRDKEKKHRLAELLRKLQIPETCFDREEVQEEVIRLLEEEVAWLAGKVRSLEERHALTLKGTRNRATTSWKSDYERIWKKYNLSQTQVGMAFDALRKLGFVNEKHGSNNDELKENLELWSSGLRQELESGRTVRESLSRRNDSLRAQLRARSATAEGRLRLIDGLRNDLSRLEMSITADVEQKFGQRVHCLECGECSAILGQRYCDKCRG